MKTYFKYEGIIKSKEAAEAIAAPIGLGPFCGFGSAKVSGSTLTIQAEANDGTVFKQDVADRIMARYMVKNTNDGEDPDINFGCISRDGYVYISSDKTLDVTIQGAQGANQDVFVFAVHQEVTEPIENPISFVAYWSSSSESFYTLYKKSLNPYYPLDEKDITWDIVRNNPASHEQLNYSYLIKQVEGACEAYKNSKNTMVLVGIYGTGTDAASGENENFAIIPYGGSFPQPLYFNTAYSGLYEKSLNRIENITKEFSGSGDAGNITVKTYIDNKIKEVLDSISGSQGSVGVPAGVIAMYSGTTPPEGWAFCDGTSGRPNLLGRFVVGYNPSDPDYSSIGNTGGVDEVTLTIQQIPSHDHKVNFKDYKWGDNADWRPFVSEASIGDSNKEEFQKGKMTQKTGGGQPHENRPPYFVLAYIIKL